MKISLNAIKKYVDIDIPTPELLKLIGTRLVEVEGYEDLSDKYKGITIVKVKTCKPIPETHLTLCQIFDGTKEHQVVCGAPNVREGMLTVWLKPGCIVPETYGGENFVLSVKKLRGYESSGMLAAADELGFRGASHDGIVEIDPDFAVPGDDFAEKFGMNDVILDIENKSLTHRPDTFGIIGFAREIAGILGQNFKEPTMITEANFAYEKLNSIHNNDTCDISIETPDFSICPCYSAAVIEVKNISERSPYFTPDDVFLYKSDMRPISPIVDATNIIMLETGQPLHAFDYDKFVSVGGLENPKIIVRLAKAEENIELLDGKMVACEPTDILITSNNVPVALAGAMGGKNTEIDSSTKRIIVESATFSLYNLRKTQMAHGIFSEAITRFTKGQPAFNCLPALAEITERFGGEVEAFAAVREPEEEKLPIMVHASDINSLLGSDYPVAVIIETLRNVGFTVEANDDELEVSAPLWRTDIHIKEDIIEEVGRLLGYDNIPIEFPSRKFVSSEVDPVFSLKKELRNLLSSKYFMNEVLTYSFVSGQLYKKANLGTENLYRIVNSISPELQYFRSAIVPSLIDKISVNERAGHENFSLFEMNQVSDKSLGLSSENVPNMKTHLAIVTTGDFYKIKSIISSILDDFGIQHELSVPDALAPYFEKKHSAGYVADGEMICTFGELSGIVSQNFKIKNKISVAEIDLEYLLSKRATKERHISLNKFPTVTRDITIQASSSVVYQNLESAIRAVLNETEYGYKVICTSIYKKSKKDSMKNTTFKITLNHPAKTLTNEEVANIIEKITVKLASFQATII